MHSIPQTKQKKIESEMVMDQFIPQTKRLISNSLLLNFNQ
jgi:hypothetical protein